MVECDLGGSIVCAYDCEEVDHSYLRVLLVDKKVCLDVFDKLLKFPAFVDHSNTARILA